MNIQDNAGSAILVVSGGNGFMNALGQVDTIVSIVVGLLSIVGIGYSIVWHRSRIRAAARQRDNG